MTLQGMVLGLSGFCHGPAKWLSGRMQAGTPGNKLLQSVLSQKKIESSERLSVRGLSSSSKPHLICFDSAFVAMCLPCVCISPCAIIMLKLMYCDRKISDDSLLLQLTHIAIDSKL